MAKVFRVCYTEQPFTIEELDKYKYYFEYINGRRVLSHASITLVEDDHLSYNTCAEEEISYYITNDEYYNFRDKLGEYYDLLLRNEIDYIEFE